MGGKEVGGRGEGMGVRGVGGAADFPRVVERKRDGDEIEARRNAFSERSKGRGVEWRRKKETREKEE